MQSTMYKQPWMQWYDGKMEELKIPRASVYSMLQNTAERFPNHNAVIFEDKMTDYESLKKQVDKLAGAWQEMGFKKGEKIGLMMENHPYFIVSYYAALALGLIVIQINPRYTLRELQEILKDTHPQYIVFDQQASKIVGEAQVEYPFKVSMSIEDGMDNDTSISELIEYNIEINHPVQINPQEDIAVIQYTGGTTGKTKGAILTHYNLASNVMQNIAFDRDVYVPGKEIILLTTPLYHVLTMTLSMNLGIYLGATILMHSTFNLQNCLESIRKFQPTYFCGVPKIYSDFVRHPEINQYGLESLKKCICGSAPLPVEMIRRFEELIGDSLFEGYGLTEAAPTTHMNPPIKRKAGSIGVPLPGTDCKIIDDHNNEMGVNEIGELLIKGPQVMKGYWNKEEETKLALHNGWLHTGDLARMDDEGFFYIVGRKKDMIIVGGFNVYPNEVEEVLHLYPDIKEAAVVGIPHPEGGEMVKAFLVPKDDVTINTEDVKNYCYSRLTRYKVPKEYEIIQELPRNSVQKVLKRLLVKKELEKTEKDQKR